MKVNAEKMAEKIKEYCLSGKNNFEIYYHVNPDGDCIGSAYGLALILRELGAKCAVKGQDAVPLQFSTYTDVFENDIFSSPVLVGVDCKDRSRTGNESRNRTFDFWIDHHGSQNEEAEYEYVNSSASSCAELVLTVAEKLGIKISPEAANLLFTGLVTDTNCFRTTSTDRYSFEAAAKLAGAGADINTISRRYALLKSEKRMNLEKILLESMHIMHEGRFVMMSLSLADLESAGIESQDSPELDSINGFPEIFETAVLTVMLREYPAGNGSNSTRFSVKSSVPEIHAGEIAEKLGGGGHAHAAGGYLELPLKEAGEKIEKTCSEYLKTAVK